MGTLNITLNDALMEKVRPSFSSHQAIMDYAQKQLEEIFVRFAEQHAGTEAGMLYARNIHHKYNSLKYSALGRGIT